MNRILITGGAGFIGSNAAVFFSRKGWDVMVLDDLSRRGSRANLAWLSQKTNLRFEQVDVRNVAATENVVRDFRPDVLLHLAGQVAVTTSVKNPRTDFEINALGTFNMLEAVRAHTPECFFINISTNKVYGEMPGVVVTEGPKRYEYRDIEGISEVQPLAFHSPYGCSKGVADQYTIDYARIYGLRTVTLRQSCIYGPRQMGIEDQGWVAWFIIAALLERPITIYGNGKQIRDVLHVDDLVRCYEQMIEIQPVVKEHVFNIGGGSENTLSLRELVALLEVNMGKKLNLEWSSWRSGDQRIFVSNIDRAKRLLDWKPLISAPEGVSSLIDWVSRNKDLFDWMVSEGPATAKRSRSGNAVSAPEIFDV